MTDEQIDAIAHTQDDEGCFTGRLTRLEWRAFARALLAAHQASALPLPEGWKPISTAPKDGTVIVLRRDDRVTPGNWHEWSNTASEYSTTGEYLGQSEQDGGANWNSWDGGFTDEEPPTLWLPLPGAD